MIKLRRLLFLLLVLLMLGKVGIVRRTWTAFALWTIVVDKKSVFCMEDMEEIKMSKEVEGGADSNLNSDK